MREFHFYCSSFSVEYEAKSSTKGYREQEVSEVSGTRRYCARHLGIGRANPPREKSRIIKGLKGSWRFVVLNSERHWADIVLN